MDLKALLGLKKQVLDTRDHVTKLRADLERLKRERDELTSAPAAKSDLKAALERYLAEEASDWRVYLAAKLDPLIRAPSKLASPELVARHFSPVGAPVPAESMPSVETMDCTVNAMLGQVARQAYLQAIDGLDYVEGPPMAERSAALAKLDAAIKLKAAQLNELLETARGAGIMLDEVEL